MNPPWLLLTVCLVQRVLAFCRGECHVLLCFLLNEYLPKFTVLSQGEEQPHGSQFCRLCGGWRPGPHWFSGFVLGRQGAPGEAESLPSFWIANSRR